MPFPNFVLTALVKNTLNETSSKLAHRVIHNNDILGTLSAFTMTSLRLSDTCLHEREAFTRIFFAAPFLADLDVFRDNSVVRNCLTIAMLHSRKLFIEEYTGDVLPSQQYQSRGSTTTHSYGVYFVICIAYGRSL